MAFATSAATPNVDAETAGDLYRHEKRPEWGLAIMVREDDRYRSYQFEDGRLRKIRGDFDRLMEPVDDFDATPAVRETLTAAITEAVQNPPSAPLQPVVTFKAQIAAFREQYPKGFQDPEYVAQHRGAPGESPLKRHRDPVLRKAGELLTSARCSAMMEEGRAAELTDEIAELMAGTDLAPLSHVKRLRALDDEQKQRHAGAVVELLHGEEHFSRRMRAFLEVSEELFGRRPSWRVATLLPALVAPDRHVAVRRSAFKRQAASIAPSARYTKRPRAGSYRNYRRVAMGVRKRLVKAGLEPRDFVDVHEFIWATLRTSALPA